MAKDPNYNRYAGMTSLPGDPLNPRKPRPYQVDEDGEVIYLDVDSQGAKLDRGVRDRLSRLSAANAEPLIPPQALPDVRAHDRKRSLPERKTIGGIDYHVMSANTYDPERSNGKTAIPNAEMIAATNANIRQMAVPDAGPERGAYTIRLPLDFSAGSDDRPVGERNLPLTNPKGEMYYSVPALGAEPGKTRTANTLNFGKELLVGTVALGHGHPDGDSNGMVDDVNPELKNYGDIKSFLIDNPIPMATVSEGRVGWHQLEDGKIQFMYPVGTKMGNREAAAIQRNLDRQQSLFQRKAP
jgi:hypothetical protein